MSEQMSRDPRGMKDTTVQAASPPTLAKERKDGAPSGETVETDIIRDGPPARGGPAPRFRLSIRYLYVFPLDVY